MDDILKMMVSDDEDDQVSKISTLVFMDLEATGLPSFIGKKNVHITEISLVAVDRTDFENDSSLRVLNKLSLCIRPRTAISPTAMSITGLYNDVLDNQEKFDESVPKLLEYFFRRLRRPLCLLAHNGTRYDFPLLQAELKNIHYGLDPGILCADTLEAFRFISSQIPKSLNPSISHNGNGTIPNSSTLDEETDNLLSADMDLFKDIDEPIFMNNSKPTYIGNQSSSKINPLLDERTPPKSKSQDCLSNPKPIKRIKQGPTTLPKAQTKGNIQVNQHPQAKRQLFADGTSNKSGSRPVQFSLEKLYFYYFGEAPPKSHYAEADCIALSKVCQKVNKEFLQWVDENSRSFSETEAMW